MTLSFNIFSYLPPLVVSWCCNVMNPSKMYLETLTSRKTFFGSV